MPVSFPIKIHALFSALNKNIKSHNDKENKKIRFLDLSLYPDLHQTLMRSVPGWEPSHTLSSGGQLLGSFMWSPADKPPQRTKERGRKKKKNVRNKRTTAIDLPLLCSSFLNPVSSNMHNNSYQDAIVYTHKLFSICNRVVLAELHYKRAVSHFHCKNNPCCPRFLIWSLAPVLSVHLAFMRRKRTSGTDPPFPRHLSRLSRPVKSLTPPPSLISHVVCEQKRKLHSERKSDLNSESHGSAAAA